MSGFVVALRRGNGQEGPSLNQVDLVAFWSLLRQLEPFQELHVTVVPDRPEQEKTP